MKKAKSQRKVSPKTKAVTTITPRKVKKTKNTSSTRIRMANNSSSKKKAAGITPDDILADVKNQLDAFVPIQHNLLLSKLLGDFGPVDFRVEAEITDPKEKVTRRHFVIYSIIEVFRVAMLRKWDLCYHNGFTYIYNGAYWKALSQDELKSFLGRAAEKMGVPKDECIYYKFKDELLKQFLSAGYLTKPERKKGRVQVNLGNGTFEITDKNQLLRAPMKEDFLTYQLPFHYDRTATSPMFIAFLNQILPDPKLQLILAEFISYVFISIETLKLEKALFLYGGGSNGKSVIFDIIMALLGDENVSSYSLKNLTNENGYARSMLPGKLLNYASELNGHEDINIFKQLVSGESLDARLPYGIPMIIRDYAKMMFNCNKLPREIEHTLAYFRRLIIIPFRVTIPEPEQDKQLAQKIIASELPGVFNWVLEGLRRLLSQKGFTVSDTVKKEIEDYKSSTDNIQQFIKDEHYVRSNDINIPLKQVYSHYRSYCSESGYRSCALNTFSERLRQLNFRVERKNTGNVVYAHEQGK